MNYELTLTLRPSLYRFTAQEQYDKCYESLRTIFKYYKVFCIAELTQENNVHYHCIIELKSFKERALLLDKFRKHNHKFGRKTCTQLIDYPKYVEYLFKDIEKTSQLINDYVLQDDFELVRARYIQRINGFTEQCGSTGQVIDGRA